MRFQSRHVFSRALQSISYTIPTNFLTSNRLYYRPLIPNACTTFSLTLLPLISGRLDLAVIRILDKETGEVLDIKNFPDVMVKGRVKELDVTDRDEE